MKGDIRAVAEILVTGGAGFIGGHLAEELVSLGHNVTVIDDLSNGRVENLRSVWSNITFIQKDITTPIESWFTENPPIFEAIYHLACWPRSRSFVDPIRDVQVNVIGTINVIRLALKTGARVIFSSNSGIYATENIPISENIPDNPKTPYDLDKLHAEKFLKLYGTTFGLDFVIFRFATVYGPRQRVTDEWKPVVMEFIKKLQRRRPPVIYWDGNQTRDFIFVKDLVEALILALNCPQARGETMILGSETETSIDELYSIISKQLDVHIDPIRKPMIVGDIARMCYDCSKAHDILGWKAHTTLEEGIRMILRS
jgi:UDP-glucose 4-epimerase